MEEQLKKKEAILKFVKSKLAEKSLGQVELMELSQDLNRANHNIKHMIRGNTNPAGRYSCLGLGAIVAYFWVCTKLPKKTGYILPAVVGIVPIAISSYAFWRIGVWKFSSEGDAEKNKSALESSMIIDNEFRDIVKSYKKA
jgi:hypothetical protein